MKLVIKTSLHYDSRSEKHQSTNICIVSHAPSGMCERAVRCRDHFGIVGSQTKLTWCHQSRAQNLEMAPGFFGKFVDCCPERFYGAVLLLRGKFSDSNLAQLLLKPRTVPIYEVKHAWVLFKRLVSTFMVGHFLYGDTRERRREFDASYSGRRYVGLSLLTMNPKCQWIKYKHTLYSGQLSIEPRAWEE
jgi:hypothetical protein